MTKSAKICHFFHHGLIVIRFVLKTGKNGMKKRQNGTFFVCGTGFANQIVDF